MMSKILSIIGRKKIAGKKNRRNKKQNRLIPNVYVDIAPFIGCKGVATYSLRKVSVNLPFCGQIILWLVEGFMY